MVAFTIRAGYVSKIIILCLLIVLPFPVSALENFQTGVYRPGVGFYLKIDNGSTWNPSTDIFLAWDNAAADLPVAGDWNGDGRDETGVYRPGVGFYLKMDNGSTWNPSTDSYLAWDNVAADLPVAGDWNADGRDETGVYRPGVGFYLKMDDGSTWNPSTDSYLAWDNAAADLPVAGDWNGDGRDETGVYQPGAGFYLKMDNGGTWNPSTDRYLTWDNAQGDLPLAGSISVIGVPIAPFAAFMNATPRSGTAPLTVMFTDQSTNSPTSWKWEYRTGGGSWTEFGSGLRNPSNGFAAGTYDIRLTATNTAGSNTVITTGFVTVSPAPAAAIAAFTADKQSGTVPLTVTFTDQSTGAAPLTYAWDFTNDGINDSTTQNPSYTYPAAGTYTVRLTATNAVGSDAEIKTGYITVNPAVAPTAAFTANKQSGTVPLIITFTDQSTGTAPMTYTWDFTNDGVNDSTTQNPSYTYPAAGTYTVRLTATNAVGSDAEIKTSYITVNPVVAPTAAFTANKQSGTAPLTVTFTDQSTGTAPLTYAWDYTNDGVNESTTRNPSFTYSNAGTYTVRLTTTNAGGSDAEIKTGYISVSPAPVAPTAAFTSDKQSGIAQLTVLFTDQSTGTAPLTYAWDFTNDGVNDNTTQNPSHTYSSAGTYTVRLTATNAGGSDAEIKTGYIIVTAVPVAPTAAFTSNTQSGTVPLTVTFTDQSTGTAPLTYAWDFTNDGVNDSTTRNPIFTYPNAGTYTVRLTATNAVGSDAEIKTSYITVNPVVAPAAAFTADKQSGTAPLTVTFTDQSTGSSPLTYAWDFTNDGVNDSTTRNPSFTYSNAGTYTVRLTATNAGGSDAEIKSGYITVTVAPPGSHAGLALTFDDNFIDEWYAIRPILNKYNAHATFFVSNFATLNQDQINKLKTLQADGNEIAYHGYNHEAASEYLKTHSMQEYLDNEIINGVTLMKAQGFNPVDFAYPYGFDDPAATVALQAYFRHIRDTYYDWDDTAYYQQGSHKAYISAIEIDDRNSGNSIDDIYNGIAKAKRDDKILILFGHTTVPTVTDDWQVSYDRLEKTLKNVSDNNMKFYTVSELT